jgi:hypothetical protein
VDEDRQPGETWPKGVSISYVEVPDATERLLKALDILLDTPDSPEDPEQ